MKFVEERICRLGILFSGGGRTLENLARELPRLSEVTGVRVEIVAAISSHTDAGGIERARRLGIACEVIDYREAGSELSARILRILDERGVDLVLLAGFIRRFDFPPRYRGKVLNIHPSLLPSFGGKGFYGKRVHEAVLNAGARFSGCTVHVVTDEYDEGPVVLQRVVPVRDDDDADSLAERVFQEECAAYPEALRLFLEGRVEIVDRFARLTAPHDKAEPLC